MTTGRINQVASVDCAARASPAGGRSSATARVVWGNRNFNGTGPGNPPAPAARTASERSAAPARRDGRAMRGRGGTRGRPSSPPVVPREATGRKGSSKGRGYRRTGRQHRNRRETPRRPGLAAEMKKVACGPFDARARSRPAGTT